MQYKNKISRGILAFFAIVLIASVLFFSGAKNVNAGWEDWMMSYSRFIMGSAYTNTVYDAAAGNAYGTTTTGYESKCSVEVLNPITWIRCLLVLILYFAGGLVSVAASIFGWIIDPSILSNILNSDPIYQAWTTIRDLFNIVFIMFLLFSAFATIFQVEKFSYKKTLLTLVLMALLVNFSYPLSRFIVDIGNTLMYTIANNLGINANAGIFAKFSDNSMVAGIVSGDPSIPGLIAAIVFVFILAMTLLVVALMFLIRTIALAILIIFSPIAFVGAVISVPGFGSGKWWDYMFRYVFFGPAMMLMIYISGAIMGGMQNQASQMFAKASQQSDSVIAPVIAQMSLFTIPIILLWLGLGLAQQMGIAGAAGVTSGIKKGGKWLAQRPQKLAWSGIKATGAPGGAKQTWEMWNKKGFPGKLKNIPGLRGEERTKEAEAHWAERFGVKGAEAEFNRKKIQEQRDEWKKQGGLPEKELQDIMGDEKKTKSMRQAAALDLADKYNFFGPEAWKNFEAAKKLVGDDRALDTIFDKEVKDKRIDLVMRHKVENPEAGKPPTTYAGELEKLSVSDFGKMQMEDLYKASPDAKKAIEDYFGKAKSTRKIEISKNINGKNQAFLEKEGIFFESEQAAKQKTKQESSGAREINPEDIK